MGSRLRWALLVVLSAWACSPEYEVLSSGCDADVDCGVDSFCDEGACVVCDVLYERCAQDCSAGYAFSGERRGGCLDCYCLDEMGSGGTPTGGAGGGGLGGVPVGGTLAGGTEGLGAAPTGGLETGGSENLAGCGTHTECPVGMRCEEGACLECDVVPVPCDECEDSKEPLYLLVNGCEVCECIAPNECISHDDCEYNICIPGEWCEDECRDLTCCFGNECWTE